MIEFKSIRYKNFLSTGNHFTEIQLNKTPNTLIVGQNGSGKSTILDSLCFALFNKAFRNINRGQLVNSTNEKDCLVEVEFKVNANEYKVVRGIKPNIFQIHKNGKLMDEDASAADQQKKLEQMQPERKLEELVPQKLRLNLHRLADGAQAFPAIGR